MRLRPLALLGLLAGSLTLVPSSPAAAVSGWTVGTGSGPDLSITWSRPSDGVHRLLPTVDRSGRGLAAGQPVHDGQAARQQALVRAKQPALRSNAQLSQWVVTYGTGFASNPQAQAAFQRAVDTWSHIVASDVPIKVNASLTSFSDEGQLGGAGPVDFASFGGVYYPYALADALAGTDLRPGDADIEAEFSNSTDLYYYGADPTGITSAACTLPGESAPTVGDCFDFESIVLHELGHGLGFVGSVDARETPSGQRAFYGYDFFGQDGNAGNDDAPLVYDLFAETSRGTPILDYPNASQDLTDAVTSNAVYWNGPEGAGADRGREPRIYAPYPTFEQGSSFSHLSDASYPTGDPDSLMTPFAEPGDVTRDPGEVALGMFRDMGWVTPALPGAAYVPLPNPVQVYDSGAIVGNGALKDVTIAGTSGVPASAVAVVLNLTGAAPSANSQLSAYARPRTGSASAPPARVPNLVTAAGSTKDGLATVPLGYGGVRFRTVGGAARNFASVVGYFLPATDGGAGYVSANAHRVLDTRTGTGTAKARVGTAARTVSISGVPSSAVAVALSVTGIKPSNTSTVQVFSSDLGAPSSGNVHLKPGQSATNLVIAKLGADGRLKVRTTLGATDVVADLLGYYDASGTGLFRPVLPQRLFGPLKMGATVRDTKVVGSSEGFGVPVGATALVVDTVASFPSSTTFLSTYATGAFPGITTVTVAAGRSASGASMTRPSAGGNVRVKNAAGTSTVSLDLFGYYAP